MREYLKPPLHPAQNTCMRPISLRQLITHLCTRAGGVLTVLLAALAISGMASAMAQDAVSMKTSLFMDASGQLGVADMASQTFKPVANPFSRGYTAAVAWIKLEVAPNPEPDLVLLVRIANLDSVQLFSPNAQSPGWRVQHTGDQVAFSQRPRPEVNLSLSLTPHASRISVHYLRITSAGVMLVSTKLLTTAQSQNFDVQAHGFMGLYEGVILLLLWLALVRWWVSRETLWGLSAVFQALTLVYMPFIMGFGSKYLLPNLPALADAAVSLLACLHLFSAGLFFLVLFRTYQAPWLAQMGYWLSVALFPLLLVLLATGKTSMAMSLNTYLVMLQTVWGIGAVWFLRIDDVLLRRLLRGTYLALILYVLYFMLPLLGLDINAELTIYPGLLSSIFVAVMQHLLLMRRTQLQLRAQQQLSLHVVELGEKLKWETARRAETNSFMGMLMHEIKTPLASIRVATQSLVSGRLVNATDQHQRINSIQKSVESIDAVLERCVETDRLEQGVLSVEKEHHNVARLLFEWASADAQHARIKLHLPVDLSAHIDATLLHMMVRNLLSNALSYSPEQSTVSLTLRAQAPSAPESPTSFVIEVRNATGRAGKPDPLQVFKKYYRAPTAHHTTGTGLGLYWVHSVMKMLNGHISYQAQGDDVVMTLCLPC